jgi:mannose-6-phosphate isomerase-like protein (cupin superfamily)
MRSGLVVLAPGKSVGKHSTDKHEEVLVVLEGTGEMLITGEVSLPVVAGTAVYCPPHREHNVLNTGEGALRYVFVVARALP